MVRHYDRRCHRRVSKLNRVESSHVVEKKLFKKMMQYIVEEVIMYNYGAAAIGYVLDDEKLHKQNNNV